MGVVKKGIEDSKYFELFRNCVMYGSVLFIECESEVPIRIKYQDCNNEMKYSIFEMSNRKVKDTEYIYIIRMYQQADTVLLPLNYFTYYIPQSELRQLLSIERFSKLFANIEKLNLSNSPIVYTISSNWYQMDSQSKIQHEYGSGLYLFKDKEIVNNFGGMTAKVHWYNEDLSILYNLAVVNNKLTNGENFIVKKLKGKNGEIFNVCIFTKDSKVWRSSLWKGIVESEIQTGFDMVIGPMSIGDIFKRAKEIKEEIDKYQWDAVVKESKFNRFLNNKFRETIRRNQDGEAMFQLCVYNQKVLHSFEC